MFRSLALFIVFYCVGVSAGNESTHMLQFITVITPSISSTIGKLDNEQFLSYCITEVIPTMCKKKEQNNHTDDYKVILDWIWREQDNQQHLRSQIVEHFNHTNGNRSLHMMCKCELKDDVPQEGSITFRYDGRKFMSLNTENGTWTAADDKAESFLNERESAERDAKHWKHYLKNDCIQILKFILKKKANRLLQNISVSKSSNDSTSWELDCEQLQTLCLNVTEMSPKTEPKHWHMPIAVGCCIFAVGAWKGSHVFSRPVERIKTCINKRMENGDTPQKDFITVPLESPSEDCCDSSEDLCGSSED